MKAVALFSGGLDSILAIKIIQQAGIEVEALYFDNPFHSLHCEKGVTQVTQQAEIMGFKLHIFKFGEDYLKVIENPRYGYGKNINPCIDCRIYQLQIAKLFMEKIEASFIITGEVVGQRPMSQRREAMILIDREAGVQDLVLRPLSAKRLPPTLPEREGWVNRQDLLDIKGRSRKTQMDLAAAFGIDIYPTPAGGCLLTSPEFAKKVKDLLNEKKPLNLTDIHRLKVGRHFRFSPQAKGIVGRNAEENRYLAELASPQDLIFKVRDYQGPLTLGVGEMDAKVIQALAQITARYSDAPKDKPATVIYYHFSDAFVQEVSVIPATADILEQYRIN